MGQGYAHMSAGAQGGKGIRSPWSWNYRQRELRAVIKSWSFARALFVLISEPSVSPILFPFCVSSPNTTVVHF